MNNEPMSAAEMITKLFSNIDKANIEKSNELNKAWKETILKINSYGEKLSAHTKIIDFKNGSLLVETDHPGWSQILQMNESFIIKGLNWKIPNLGIKSMMIRLEGSDVNFTPVDYDAALKKGQNKMAEQLDKNQEEIEKIYKRNKDEIENAEGENNLPPELLEKFDFIRKNLVK